MLETRMSVDPFVGNGKGNLSELIGEVTVEELEMVDITLRKYEVVQNFSSTCEAIPGIGSDKMNCEFISDLELEVLNPVQVSVVTQEILSSLDKSDLVAGFFLTRLIQDSHDAGYNDFFLTMGDTPLYFLGFMLKGNSEEKLRIEVKGDVGYGCGVLSERCAFTIKGDAGIDCGASSTYGEFVIENNAGMWCGSESSHSSFTLEGSVEEKCGEGSWKSTYITSNKDTYEDLERMIPKKAFWFFPTRNKVIYQPK